MGKIYFGLVLTLLVSLLVMLAGGLVARRAVVDVTEVDRDVFQDFVTGFGSLVEEQEAKREEVLVQVAGQVEAWRESEGRELLERLTEVPGVRGAFFFNEGRKSKEWIDLGGIGSRSAAEVVMEGKKVPLIPERAVVIAKSFFDEVRYSTKGRIENEEGSFHGWWYSPLQGEVVVLLIENEVAKADFLKGLKEEAATLFEVTERLGETLAVGYEGKYLLGGDLVPEVRGASRETTLGHFSVKAWSLLEQRSFFHWPTMWTAGVMGLLIATVGVVLFFSQRRMWRESEERVSFVNRVSHELGTPLTNMTLNLELASRSLRSQPEVAGKRLEKVREEVARLGRLVTNVLTHSRKAGEEIPDHRVLCDPDAVVAGVVEQFRPALERREVVIDWEPGRVGEMKVDADALAQVVWNLISNVEKYAASGKWVGVETRLSEGDLKVEVRDRGEGILKGKRAEIFEAFERVHDSIKEGVSGTGLGLSISRDLAEAMGGELLLLDHPKMTVFQLMIPNQKL